MAGSHSFFFPFGHKKKRRAGEEEEDRASDINIFSPAIISD